MSNDESVVPRYFAILWLFAAQLLAQDPKVALIVNPDRPSSESKLLKTILDNHGYTIVSLRGDQASWSSIRQNIDLVGKLLAGKNGSLFFYHSHFDPSRNGFTLRELTNLVSASVITTKSIWINACSPDVFPTQNSYNGVISGSCQPAEFAQALTGALRFGDGRSSIHLKDVAAQVSNHLPGSRASLPEDFVILDSRETRQFALRDKQPQTRDEAEHALLVAIAQARGPESRLLKLNQWQRDYPQTEFATERRQALLATYAQLHMQPKALFQARELLAHDRSSAFAVFAMNQLILNPTKSEPSTIDLWEGYSVANRWLWEINQSFAEHQFLLSKLEPEVRAASHNLIGHVAFQHLLLELAETHFTDSLKLNPNQGIVSYWLGEAILKQGRPTRHPTALFHFARAAYYEGPGSLPFENRNQVIPYLEKLYVGIQCSNAGMNDLALLTKSSALPPDGFTMKIYICHSAKGTAEEREARQAPDRSLWNALKYALIGAGGQQYFESGLKGATIPGGIETHGQKVTRFKGHVVSASPAINPKVLVVSVYSDVANVTLTLSEPIRGRIAEGTQVEFEGNATSFAKDPFMLSFDVDIADLKVIKSR